MSGPHAFEPSHGTDGAELDCAVCGEPERHLSHVDPSRPPRPRGIVSERDRYREALAQIADGQSGVWGRIAWNALHPDREPLEVPDGPPVP